MDASMTTSARQGYRMRCLRDIWVEVTVDLDRQGPVEVVTDIDALSEAIRRVAAAGGFALRLACEGGPCADAERVVADCALELGAALAEALGPAAPGFAPGDAAAPDSLPPGLAAVFIESLDRGIRGGPRPREAVSRR